MAPKFHPVFILIESDFSFFACANEECEIKMVSMQTKMNRICFIIGRFLKVDFRSAKLKLLISISK